MTDQQKIEFGIAALVILSAIGRLLNAWTAAKIAELQANKDDLKLCLEALRKKREGHERTRHDDPTDAEDDKWLEDKGIDVKGEE